MVASIARCVTMAIVGKVVVIAYELGEDKLNLLKTDPQVDPKAPPKEFIMILM